MMRIITGKAKGIKLKTLEGNETRPTAERVKEAVFSMLQFDIEGRRVLDLFSGSGQMGLEAISRGASYAVLVDRSREAIKIIEENAKRTRLYDQCKIINSDASEYIRRAVGEKFDIIFLDPPYASNLYAPILKAILKAKCIKPTSIIVLESDFENIIENDNELADTFEVKKVSKYSKTVITLIGLKETK